MNHKHVFYFFIFITSLLVSCKKEDPLPADSSSMGKIVANKEIVGTNQKVTVSCPMQIAPDATNVEIGWENNNGITISSSKYEKGIAYVTMSWPTAGVYTIKCKARYFYGNADLKNVETPFTITIRPTDFGNSFFGDSFESVKENNPHGSSKDPSLYTVAETETLFHYFAFKNAQLNQGITLAIKKSITSPTPKISYLLLIKEFLKHKHAHTNAVIKYYVSRREAEVPDFTPTKEQQAVIDQYQTGTTLTDAERILLGEMVDAKIIELNISLSWKNWENKSRNLTVSCWVNDTQYEYSLETAYLQ